MSLDASNQQSITPDTQAPEVTSGSIATNGQDASTGLAAASVEATIRDDGSGFSQGWLKYTADLAPNQQQWINLNPQNLVDGDNNHGRYTSSATFHKNAANGQWSLSEAYLADETGNSTRLEDQTEIANWIAETGHTDLSSFQLKSSNPDITVPSLNKVILDTAIQDSATGMFYIPVSVEADDDLSGIESFELEIREEDSGQYKWQYVDRSDLYGTGATADPFKTSFVLSEYAASGTWSLSSLRLYDKTGNRLYLDGSELSTFLNTSGSTGSVAINNDLNQDITDPLLTSISLVTSTIDEATGRALVTLDIDVDEQKADFDDGWIEFSKTNGSGLFEIYFDASNLKTGTLHGSGGSYRISALAPEGYSDGNWEVSYVRLRDTANNVWYSWEDSLLEALKSNGSIDNFALSSATGGIAYQEYLSDLEAPEIDPDSFSLIYVADPKSSRKNRLTGCGFSS